MKPVKRIWDIPVGRRIDGTPWSVRFVELKGSPGGPTTACVAGIYGDKALGCLAVHEIERQLLEMDLKGTVILVPAANPMALSVGTRISPDHLYLNRRFPGAPTGALTDQLAYRLFEELRNLTDLIIDLQPGSPTTGMSYIYDYGDRELTSSFGYLPMFLDRPIEGQLSVAASRNGLKSILPEFSGGPIKDLSIGVEGSLNVLRYRNQLSGQITGPKKMPVVRRFTPFHPSTAGILQGTYGPAHVGKLIGRGLIGWVASVTDGERLEEFHLEEDAILLLATTTPAVVTPGSFGFMVGYQEGYYDVPQI